MKNLKLQQEQQVIRNKMDNLVKQGKRFTPEYMSLQLELQRNIDKQDEYFHSLGY
tara:strand:+ start:149 stop:313 length:165 start_codon:yes stop_codon:yes gene_type:complete